MEEVSTDDQQEVTGKVSDLKIANQLQEAAQTNVTQAQGKQLSLQGSIRDFPDHATFREKGAKLACASKLGVCLSLTLCNKANFDPHNKSNTMALKKSETGKKMYGLSSFS